MSARMLPSQVPPDRHGNPHFSDQKQIEFFDFYLDLFVGFDGTDAERGIIAEAWWMGDWSGDRCPSLAEAKAFLAGESEWDGRRLADASGALS